MELEAAGDMNGQARHEGPNGVSLHNAAEGEKHTSSLDGYNSDLESTASEDGAAAAGAGYLRVGSASSGEEEEELEGAAPNGTNLDPGFSDNHNQGANGHPGSAGLDQIYAEVRESSWGEAGRGRYQSGMDSRNNVNGATALDSEEEEAYERQRCEDEERASSALQESSRRRAAPLTESQQETIRTAMRGISFGGNVPSWATAILEEEWVSSLRKASK